ncbi:FAD-dependent oxidoreductase [Candidatus Bathyarchaeota archaeon]|jgi:heterodisulfide reductase subunit A|nr:FAD-dependent oxidoreductase [Candidatus Bathyarchaeota archaeon]
MKVGVFVCECGGNISTTVDVDEVCRKAAETPDVAHAEHVPFLCAKPGVEAIKSYIRNDGLDRVVVASCSPHMHEAMFREAVKEAGLNPYLMEYVNIREHCSWVHSDRKEATSKAVDLVLGGIYRARALQPIEVGIQKVNPSVLVIGGGVAGITSALQLADSGHKVLMVERGPSIGGHMAQLSKTFPTLDCAPCILGPRMGDVAKHPNITLVTNASVEKVSGQVGNFHVTIQRSPRFVDSEKCVSCGRCAEKCPSTVSNEFDLGLYKRKAIYKPFPEAVPATYLIDPVSCKHCGLCAKTCPAGAVNLKEEPTTMEQDVGAIIVATGFDLLDPKAWKNYQANENVLTALQMERLAIRELAAGNILKKADGQRAREVAYILCFGSRDSHKGVPYCSGVCCPYSVKQAILLRKTLPYLRVYIYYNDLRMNGRGFEEFYTEAREYGVRFIHGKPDGVYVTPKGRLRLVAEDKDTGLLFDNEVDMVVLATAMVPSSGTTELAKTLGVSLGDDYFVAEKHPKMAPVATQRPGIYAAGAVLGPKDVRNSVVDGQAAAAEAIRLLSRGEISLGPVKPIVEASLCDGCERCIAACPTQAITLAEGKAAVNKASCNGCGICVSSCQKGALDLGFYQREQLKQQIRGVLSGKSEDVRVLGFFGDEVAYSALDAAGTARINYPSNIRVVRVPSTAMVDTQLVLHALKCGADGVVLFETDGSHEAKVTEQRVEEARKVLTANGVEPERVAVQPVLLPVFRVMGELITGHVKRVRGMGKLSPDKLQKIS